MFFRRRFPLLCIPLFALLLAGCGGQAPRTEPKTVEDFFVFRLGDREVQLQVALSAGEMQRGLMFRKTMGPDQGMVFVFEQPQIMSFWMRNTELPLDIGYFDADGALREMYPAFPHDERPVKSFARRQIVVEMNQGWYRRAGLKAGAKLDLPTLIEAIRARGYDPRVYNLH